MTGLNIDRIMLTLHGVSTEIAQAAVDGLEHELARRLSIRGVDASALRDLSPSIRLPAIESAMPFDAESLRACIAEALVAFLSTAATVAATEAD